MSLKIDQRRETKKVFADQKREREVSVCLCVCVCACVRVCVCVCVYVCACVLYLAKENRGIYIFDLLSYSKEGENKINITVCSKYTF